MSDDNTGVCKKCIVKDLIDGWGRCSNCKEPEATEDEIDATVKLYVRTEDISMDNNQLKNKIDSMSHYEMCRLWRFDEGNNPLLQGEVGDYFADRLFKHFGGFTPAISKSIGWE